MRLSCPSRYSPLGRLLSQADDALRPAILTPSEVLDHIAWLDRRIDHRTRPSPLVLEYHLLKRQARSPADLFEQWQVITAVHGAQAKNRNRQGVSGQA